MALSVEYAIGIGHCPGMARLGAEQTCGALFIAHAHNAGHGLAF